jgi:hypothetical protein
VTFKEIDWLLCFYVNKIEAFDIAAIGLRAAGPFPAIGLHT